VLTELYDHAETDPVLDVAVSHALLRRAATDGIASVRVWRPLAPALSVGRLDARDPRLRQVLQLTRQAGVPAIRRLAGGRAAAFDAGCLCLGWAQPQPRLEESRARYQLIADAIIRAFDALGADTALGEIDGEWCPGAWSVQGPSGKLAGLAQRVIAGGAWCEALIVIDAAPELRELARQVHAALGLEWSDPAQGELRPLVEHTADLHAEAATALARALEDKLGPLKAAQLPRSAAARAQELAAEHRFA
jgi:octanoyl-[GcvH]:protein N-octanoyltransferase